MGALEAVRGNCSRRTRQTTPDRWKNPASDLSMGWGSRMGMLHCDSRPGIAAVSHRHGHHEPTPRPYWRDAWDCDPCPARPSDNPPKCSPELAATVAKKWLARHGSRLSAPKSPATKENAVARHWNSRHRDRPCPLKSATMGENAVVMNWLCRHGHRSPASNIAAANENAVARSWLANRGSRLSARIFAAANENAVAGNWTLDNGSRLFVSLSATMKGNAVTWDPDVSPSHRGNLSPEHFSHRSARRANLQRSTAGCSAVCHHAPHR